MTALDRLIPHPRLVEIHRVDLAAPADRVSARVRGAALPQSPVVRGLFAVRTLVSRARLKEHASAALRLDDMTSSPQRPGF